MALESTICTEETDSFYATLTAPGVLRLVASAAVGRLPLGMVSLGIILLCRQQGMSYAVAGIVVGAYTLGTAASPPVLGRIIDRSGASRMLIALGVAFPAALLALVASTHQHAPIIVTLISGAIAGMTLPPLGACMRALWPALAHSPQSLSRAYAFEATLQELSFVCGPMLVAALVTISTPATPLLVAAAAGAGGAIAFGAGAARFRPRISSASRTASALRSVGIRTVLAGQFAVGLAFGALEVAMPAFAERHGSRTVAGILIGAYSIGSILGGIWSGTRPHRRDPVRSYLIALIGLTVGVLPLLIASSTQAMFALVLLAGLPIAPGFAAAYILLDRLGEPGQATETFAWSSTSIITGAALGTALGGLAVESVGYRCSIALAIVAGSVAALLVARRRRELSAASALSAAA